MKRIYRLSKPRTETHPQNKIKPYNEKRIQIFFSVKGKYYKEAQTIISQLIKDKKWK